MNPMKANSSPLWRAQQALMVVALFASLASATSVTLSGINSAMRSATDYLTVRNIALTVVTGVVTFLVYMLAIRPRLSPLYSVPGPNGQWFMGNLPDIIGEPPAMPHIRWTKKYGRKPFRYWGPFGTFRVFLAHPDDVNYVANQSRKYHKPKLLRKALRNLTGDGLLTAENEEHLHMRKLIGPGFNYGNIRQMYPIFQERSQAFSGYLDEFAKSGEEVDMAQALPKITLDVIGQAAFGYAFKSVEAPDNAMAQAYADILSNNVLSYRRILNNLVPGVKYLPDAGANKAEKGKQYVLDTVSRVIAKRRKDLAEGDDNDTQGPKDLLRILLLLRDEDGNGLADEQIRDQVMTFMAAGHETTSTSMTWALYALDQHPEVLAKLQRELDDVLQGNDPTVEDADTRLPYLSAVINETLRFYPPVPIMSRETQVEDTINGVKVPRGTPVFMSSHVLHRNPEDWENPDEFDPDRWSEANKSKINSRAFQPFFAGAHACIGKNFAILEMKIVLAILLSRFTFKLREGEKVVPTLRITQQPKNGLPMTVHHR